VGPDKSTLKEAGYLLANCPLFDGLSRDERATVVALARIRTFSSGETVFAIGSPGDQMMALLSGTIRISVPSAGGKELLLAMIQPGEVFGELAVLDGKERSADAVAETACTVAILDRRDILSSWNETHPPGPASSSFCVSDCGTPTKCSPKLRCSSCPCGWRRRCCGS
jgi:signal-transduction protein with cAMP-binding, CBS, and nucleotidyltransferase domain